MFSLPRLRKSSSPPARFAAGGARLWADRQALLNFFSVIALLLALLTTQQLMLTHGYTHLGASPSEQATAQRDQDNPPITLHGCTLCAVASGLHFIASHPTLMLFAVIFTALYFAVAVSPAPTFPFPAAYLSRAPPLLLN